MARKNIGADLKAMAERYALHLFNSYKRKSIEDLILILENPRSSDKERYAVCLALGNKGTDQAKEALGSVFSTLTSRNTDGEAVPYERGVRGVAGSVLILLGPPAPRSLLNGMTGNYPYPSDTDKKQAIRDLLAAIRENRTK